jgi:chitodextrinase
MDAAGNLSARSTPVSYTVIYAEPPTPPSTPTNVVASNVTATGVDLSWTSSTDNVGVVLYVIYSGETKVGSTTTNSAKITNLTPNTAYSLTVKAADAAGAFSAASAPVTFKTLPAPDTTPPSAPTLKASITSLSVTLSWSGSTDDVGVVAYDLYEQGFEAMDAKLIGSTTSTSVTLFNLSGQMTLSGTYMVTARDAAGNVSSFSNPVEVRFNETPEPQPPSTPVNLLATSFGSGVVLTWDASTDFHGQPVARYDLYIGDVYVGTVSDSSASIIGLGKGVSYAFTVRAVDVEGNASSPSNAVTVKF